MDKKRPLLRWFILAAIALPTSLVVLMPGDDSSTEATVEDTMRTRSDELNSENVQAAVRPSEQESLTTLSEASAVPSDNVFAPVDSVKVNPAQEADAPTSYRQTVNDFLGYIDPNSSELEAIRDEIDKEAFPIVYDDQVYLAEKTHIGQGIVKLNQEDLRTIASSSPTIADAHFAALENAEALGAWSYETEVEFTEMLSRFDADSSLNTSLLQCREKACVAEVHKLKAFLLEKIMDNANSDANVCGCIVTGISSNTSGDGTGLIKVLFVN